MTKVRNGIQITKDKFSDMTTILKLQKQVKELKIKADQWDYQQYWSQPGRYGHGSG